MKLPGAVMAFGLGFALAFGSLHILGDASDSAQVASNVSPR